MRVTAPFAASSLFLIGLTACGGAAASSLAIAVTDSLPGGIPRVLSAGPTSWTDSSGAALVEQNRFSGEDGTDAELGEPRSIAVDAQERIYVVDSKPAAIKVFTATGELVRTIGREGEGPGEFRVGFIAVRGGHLVLHDPAVARTSVWDTAGTFIRSWHSSCCYWSDIQLDRAGRIYVPSMVQTKDGEPARGVPYVRWSLEGVVVDTLWVPPPREKEKYWTITQKRDGKTVGMMSTSIPFRPGQTHTLHPDGGLIHGWTSEYLVMRSTTGKDTTSVFGRSWTPDPVTAERRNGELETRVKNSADNYGEENVRAAFKLEDIPATLPAIMNLRVHDSGRVWVRRYAVADTTKSYFDVFDSTGAYLGPVTVPFKMSDWGRQAWTKDGVVTIIEDEEGRPTVVRLKLQIR
jgi:hypothetical protein